MLKTLLTLLACQFSGEITTNLTGLPIPGPVLGLLLLLVLLGVGVVTQLDRLADNWLAIGVAIPVSTALGLLVTGWLMPRLSRSS